jgi:hypothetical protein
MKALKDLSVSFRWLNPAQVAEWRQLALVASLVRFAEDPQWLAVEWADGTPAGTYVTPARCVPFPGLMPEPGCLLACLPACLLGCLPGLESELGCLLAACPLACRPACLPACRLQQLFGHAGLVAQLQDALCIDSRQLLPPRPSSCPPIAGMGCWLRCWMQRRRLRGALSPCFASALLRGT